MAFRYRCKKPLKIIADDEIEEIHESTPRVLDEVGVKFADEEALRLLEDNGCKVNHGQH
jgi:trimethylamine:corrinoid methyltransferase-like protein